MTTQFKHKYSNEVHIEMSESDLLNMINDYNDLETWGFFGDPTMNTDFSFYYVVLKDGLELTNNSVPNKNGIDYKELSSVVQLNDKSWFCCEFFYSIDEFKKTKFNATFKIEIARENMPILESIVTNRRLLVLDKQPPEIITDDITQLLPYIVENPGFVLPLYNVSGLALNEHYITLLNYEE